jgi:ferredoxin
MTKIKVDGQVYEMKSGESVLSTLMRCGLQPAHSCRQGTCMTCLSKVVSGQVPDRSQSVLLKKQKEQNFFLACVCYPKEDIEVVLRKPRLR